jgi:hypothetical protein
MPVHWTIESKHRLMTVVAEGDVTRPEFDAYLDVIDNAELYTYRKLFDGSAADTSMGAENILAVGVRMRSAHQTRAVGPLAVVVSEDKIAMVSRVLGMLAAADRPMRVFHEAVPARDWILKQPV